jgi:aspartate ammonia-lyase
VENSIGLVTALSPYIGYRQAAAVAHQALETGESVYGIVLRLKLMTRDELDDLLRPENMTAPRLPLDRL